MATNPDDARPIVSIASLSSDIVEGNRSYTVAEFSVSRTGSTAEDVTVDVSAAGSGANPASASDFYSRAFSSSQVTIPAGSVSTTISLAIDPDRIYEADEGFTVTLSNPSTNAVLGQTIANGIIRNDDPVPFLSLSGPFPSTLAEGPPGLTTTFKYTVSRIGEAEPSETVDYFVTGGFSNAASGADFKGGILPSGTITFAQGETTKTISIDVIGDGVFESDESFALSLTNPNFGTVIGSADYGTISDDLGGVLHTFGTVETNPATSAGGVFALYKALLGRAPDPLGLEGFTNAVANGASLTDVANALIGSAERGVRSTDSTSYVQELYTNLLHRTADASGLQFFTDELSQGVSQATVAVQIGTSPEAQAVLAPTFTAGVFVPDAIVAGVARLFYGLLGRAPDTGGLNVYTASARAAVGGPDGGYQGLERVANGLLGTAAYASTHPDQSNAAFVDSLFVNALGRHADGSGATYYAAELAQGTSRGMVALEIAESGEAQIHLSGQIELGLQLLM
ncbi:DUF4214 domain-containing protein [Methylobacterium sp. WL103]|uniref:DUF4214 domain-containing protein n=1 Tax=Methylobacterium sp. WL103 TaxID=2603891 RepID=UPI0011C872DC|nr:DUF4214 domain-containing protein [Methylobacterium sp. WL103]TXN02307.1 DUF4214 domain-containing protein [Methylobacterium sp. WL103]